MSEEIVSPVDNDMTSQTSAENKECPSCLKAVFRVEEILCAGTAWHKSCFKCGGLGELGCQRKLNPTEFTLESSTPYCKPCYMKLLNKPAENGTATIVSASSGSDRSEIPEIQGLVKIADRRLSFNATQAAKAPSSYTIGTNRLACPKCSKTVYKAEEILLAGSSWHKSCFSCGGTSEEDGCRRILSRENFMPHGGNPFCKACFIKQPTMDRRGRDSVIIRTDTEKSATSECANTSTSQKESLTAITEKVNDASVAVTSTSEKTQALLTQGHVKTEEIKLGVHEAPKKQLNGVKDAIRAKEERVAREAEEQRNKESPKKDPHASEAAHKDLPVAAMASLAVAAPVTATAAAATAAVVVSEETKDGKEAEAIVAAQSAEEKEEEEAETTYQDEDGSPCDKDGEPLQADDTTPATGETPAPDAAPVVKRTTKIKTYFKSVFAFGKKKPVETPAEAPVEEVAAASAEPTPATESTIEKIVA